MESFVKKPVPCRLISERASCDLAPKASTQMRPATMIAVRLIPLHLGLHLRSLRSVLIAISATITNHCFQFWSLAVSPGTTATDVPNDRAWTFAANSLKHNVVRKTQTGNRCQSRKNVNCFPTPKRRPTCTVATGWDGEPISEDRPVWQTRERLKTATSRRDESSHRVGLWFFERNVRRATSSSL